MLLPWAVSSCCCDLFDMLPYHASMWLQVTPASVRSWYAALRDKELAAAVNAYTTANEAPALMRLEVTGAEALARADSTLDIQASSGASEILAAVDVDEGAMIELSIRMPPSFPLLPAEVCP